MESLKITTKDISVKAVQPAFKKPTLTAHITENNNRGRNVGILLKYNPNDPKEFEAFRALNKTLGGLLVLYGKGAN